MPDFLNNKIYSHAGMRSIFFEEVVKNYLADKHDYLYLKTRYRPKYPNSFELDVYAEKEVAGERGSMICECKFRQPNSKQLVKKEELSKFKIKKQEVEQYEQARSKVIVHSWLVTNGTKFEEGLKEEAISAGIKIMKVKLSSGWGQRSLENYRN